MRHNAHFKEILSQAEKEAQFEKGRAQNDEKNFSSLSPPRP
jgi:hypothetical protein